MVDPDGLLGVRRPGPSAAGKVFEVAAGYFFPTTSNVNVPGFIVRRGRVCPSVGGASSISAVTSYTSWLVVSSAMVRANFCVGAFSTTVNLSGESSWTTVNVPSRPLELNASCVSGSKPFASTPSPMGTVVITLPVSALTTAIILLLHPANNLRCFWSMARPLGSSQGARDQLLMTAA